MSYRVYVPILHLNETFQNYRFENKCLKAEIVNMQEALGKKSVIVDIMSTICFHVKN